MLQQFAENLALSESLYDKIKKIMSIKNISEEELYIKTELNRNIMYDLKTKQVRPKLKTVITICIGLSLEPQQSYELIRLSGYYLTNTIYLDYVYSDLIHHYYEYGINACNNRLKELGIDKKYYLGSR